MAKTHAVKHNNSGPTRCNVLFVHPNAVVVLTTGQTTTTRVATVLACGPRAGNQRQNRATPQPQASKHVRSTYRYGRDQRTRDHASSCSSYPLRPARGESKQGQVSKGRHQRDAAG